MPTCHHHVTHSSRCWLWSALIFAVSDTCHQSHCFMCAERDVAEMSLLGRLPSQCLEVGLSLQTNKRRKFHPLCAAHKGVAEPERKGQHRLQERSVHERILRPVMLAPHSAIAKSSVRVVLRTTIPARALSSPEHNAPSLPVRSTSPMSSG